MNSLSPSSGYQDVVELAKDTFGIDEIMVDKKMLSGTQKTQNYVSQSAVALRCRIMPPPCIKNPYQKDALGMDIDPFGNQRVKCGGTIFRIVFSLQDVYGEFCFMFFAYPSGGSLVLHFTIVITYYINF